MKILGHPVRVQALTILNERVASPNEIARDLEVEVGTAAYHVRALEKNDYIELVSTRPVRGATEHFYRATKRAYIDTGDWTQLPDSLRSSISATVFQSIVDDGADAIGAGTFDRRGDRHLSWTTMVLDEQGWEEVSREMADTLGRILKIQGEAASRIADSDELGCSFTVSMLGYEAPAKPRKVGPPKEV
ncbi:MAG TPA: winged helix-turn-helix domain-containing protein [Solirubrobacterales bacterium]|nr:winged helix-turn-helix domain-containing protein [Solirubrobacterales bacterium]